MSEECENVAVLRLIEDEYARAILLQASRQPMSASELSEAIDASPPTVYRRLDGLVRCELLVERTEFVDDGPNFSVYATRVEEIAVGFADGELTVALTERDEFLTDETTAERFTRLYEAFR